MKEHFKKWDFMRVLRLALGIYIIVQSIISKDWLFVGAGVLFSIMPIMNIGCCGSSSCNTCIHKNKGKVGDISYEEVR